MMLFDEDVSLNDGVSLSDMISIYRKAGCPQKTETFFLHNIDEIRAKKYRSFSAPLQKDIDALKKDDKVELFYEYFDSNKNINERFIVQIKERDGNIFCGRLLNEPLYSDVIEGQYICFMKYNISCIIGKLDYDLNSTGTISYESFKKKMINIAIKIKELESKSDSGWRFLYGNETEEYLKNKENTHEFTLDEILYIEPLLEHVLGKENKIYIYEKSINDFIAVSEKEICDEIKNHYIKKI